MALALHETRPMVADASPRGLAFEPAEEAEVHAASASRRWWLRLRLWDWALCLAIIVGFEALGKFGPVYCRSFHWNDASLGHRFKPNTFPTYSLVPISVAPAGVFIVSSFVAPIGESPFYEASTLALMQARTIALNAMFTEPLKLYAGRLRPDFLARLERAGMEPSASSESYLDEDEPGTLVSLCNVTDAEVVEGRKSFPSGHSSTSFAALVPLSLFLMHRIGVLGAGRGSMLRLIVGLLPLSLAAMVAVSRTRDEWHHFTDVLGGAVIGAVAGTLAYFLSMEPVVKEPHSRTFGTMLHGPTHGDERSTWADYRPRPATPRYSRTAAVGDLLA